jgi:TolB-like protein/Tfp pilus assembly protein PilF
MSLFNELKRRNVIRVAIAYLALAWLLTEVSGTLFPVFGIPDWGIRFLVIVFALGFVPALIISWVYELTPEGIKREQDVVRDASITHLTAKRLDVFTIGLIVVALAFILADRFWMSPRLAEQSSSPAEAVTDTVQTPEPEPQYPPNSIAVLPFVNMSDDAGNEYFSDGISEELLNLLSKIPEMRVISRSSAFSFKGKNVDIPTIAKQLNVAHILEGSVRKAGNQVRITAQLIETRSDTHLWSETYDRQLENIFAIQDEISAAIIGALKERLGLQLEAAPEVIAAANTEAHDAYLRGRHLIVQRTKTSIEGAASEFEKAISLDPDYALAHAELAIATLLLWRRNYGDLTFNEVISRATPHAERSMALDPKLAEAHAATGLLFASQSEYEKALTHYEQAIQFNPNYSIVYSWMGGALNTFGRYKESFLMQEKSLRLDPLSFPAVSNYVRSLISRNRLDDAARELEKIAAIYPDLYSGLQGSMKSVGGNWANMVLGSLDALRLNPTVIDGFNLHFSFAVIGLEEEALTVFEFVWPAVLHILGKTRDAVTLAEVRFAGEFTSFLRSRSELSLALAAVGDYDRARPFLEEIWQLQNGLVVQNGLFKVSHAAALIAIRRDAGEVAEVNEVIAAIRDNVRRYREAGITGMTGGYWNTNADYEEGLAAYLEGERERGLALIAKATDSGFFILPNEAYLQTLYDDPGFAPILAGQEARQTSERNRFLAIVCTDNPYEEVWQPAEGTCERFAAEGEN